MNYKNRQLLHFLPEDNWWSSENGGFLALVDSEQDLIQMRLVDEGNVDFDCLAERDSIPRMLMIGNKPAIMAGVKYGECFTCYRYFVKAGPALLPSIQELEELRHAADNAEEGELGVIQKALPLINLLAKGMYHFKLEKYYPTDGEGNFFWMPLNRERIYDCVRFLHTDYGPAMFLAPTQPVTAFNPARVEEYRRKIQKGEQVGGIAFKYLNHLSFLLDGHHRATAAMLEGVDFSCLTIDRIDSWCIGDNGKTMVVDSYDGGREYYDLSNLPPNFSFIKKGGLLRMLDEAFYKRYLNGWSREKQDFAWPAEYSQKASQYPTMMRLIEKAYREERDSWGNSDTI